MSKFRNIELSKSPRRNKYLLATTHFNHGLSAILQILLVGFLLLFHDVVLAGAISPPIREEMLNKMLEGFWGHAKMPDGNLYQPESDEDRKKLPINDKVANFAFDVGEFSGLAQWCGVKWESNFEALLRSARKNGQTEKQVAFIAVVHGAAQSAVYSTMLKTEQCSPQVQEVARKKVESFLANEPK